MTTPADPPIRVLIAPVTPFQQNTSLVWCARTGAAAFVDPGGEIERLEAALAGQAGLKLAKIMLTHGHLDHAGAAAALAERHGVPIEGPHAAEAELLASIPSQAARWGMPEARACTPDRWLDDGDQVVLGEARFDVFHCPGHTLGHVVFVDKTARFAFAGDVLFKGSIGRTDFPGGSFETLIASIRTKLFPLGDDIRFVPGHGELSTFGWERRTNPYVSDLAVGAA
jgi:glyoxylase-like metal-dependent hydrolase (beta-lactamase superfamily II)